MIRPLDNQNPTGPIGSSPASTPVSAGSEVASSNPQRTRLVHAGASSYKPKFALKKFQADSIACIERGEGVMVTAPTGSGKTVIAYDAMMKALKEKRTFIYAAPLKAINEQKLREFQKEIAEQMFRAKSDWNLDSNPTRAREQAIDFVKTNVGLITGDRVIHPEAPVKIMTTEVYNLMSKSNTLDKNRTVVFDEFHYLGDRGRGRVWEESIMFTPPEAQVICLSATMGNADSLTQWANQTVHGKQAKIKLIQAPEAERPVKLRYYIFNEDAGKRIRLKPLEGEGTLSMKLQVDRGASLFNHQLLGLVKLLKIKDKLPVVFFRLNRSECDESAKYFVEHKLQLTNSKDREDIAKAIAVAKARNPRLEKLEAKYLPLLLSGVASHHAEHLPEYNALVEELFEKKLVKAVVATSTLAAGVNMPARTTVITQLSRGSGAREIPLSVSEVRQMAGRAGRAGLDKEGNVIIFADLNQVDQIKEQYIDAPPENIYSSLRPNYEILFNLTAQAQSDKALEAALEKYIKRSLGHFQAIEKEEDLERTKRDYLQMLKLLKELHYISDKNQITNKGKIAQEIKFNNPLFVTEFLFGLAEYIRDKGPEFQFRPDALAAVVSLFSQNYRLHSKEKFEKFRKSLDSKASDVNPLLDIFIKTRDSLDDKQSSTGIWSMSPSIDYNKFLTVRNWTNSCVAEPDNGEIGRLAKLCKGEPPGAVLDALRRTAKLIEYISKAKQIANFPKLLKAPLETTKAIFDERKNGILNQKIQVL